MSLDHALDLEGVVERIVAELRAGGRPHLDEYRRGHPEWSDQLAAMWPALVNLELARSDRRDRREETALPVGEDAPPLGDFRLVREIGRGGMGVVYEAVQQSLNRRVALKVLPAWAARMPRLVQRFEQEARAVAKLHHTNIVAVFGVGQAEGVHFLVMQLIDGHALDEVVSALRQSRDAGGKKTLSTAGDTPPAARAAEVGQRRASESDALPSGTLQRIVSHWRAGAAPNNTEGATISAGAEGDSRWRSVARLGLQAAEALRHAHGQGLVHRDIKPSNILLDERGNAWITDFGLAKMADSAELTMSGELVGTLRYLPPERLRGQADARGDIYSLGATLYELATLRPPFVDDEQAVLLKQIADAESPRPGAVEPDIPRDLETILVKAMAKDPADRYQTADAVAEDLRRFLDDRPILARPASAAEQIWRWCRRHPTVAIPTATSLLLLSLIAIGSLVFAARLNRQTIRAQASEARAINIEVARRQELFRAHVNNARGAVTKAGPGQRLDGLQAIHDAMQVAPAGQRTGAQEFDLVDAAIPCLARWDVCEESRLKNVARRASTEIDVSPDFEAAAKQSDDGFVTLAIAVDHGRVVRSFDAPGGRPQPYGMAMQYSRQGRWLTATGYSAGDFSRPRLYMWESQSGRLAFTHDVVVSQNGIGFHPNERKLALARQSQVQVIDLTTGQVTDESPARFRGSSLAYSADGQWLAIGGSESAVEIVDPATWQTRDLLTEAGPALALAFDPRRPQFLTLGTIAGRIYVWDAEARRGEFRTDIPDTPGKNKSARIESIRYSENGQFLAINTPGHAQIRHADGDEGLLDLPGEVRRFSPDGQRIAYVVEGRDLVIGRLQSATLNRRAPHGAAEHVSVSPDGRLLAISGVHGVDLCAADSLKRLGTLGMDQCGPVAFETNGASLVTFGIFSQACRWPVHEDAGGLHVGPPQPILSEQFPDFENGPLAPQHQGRHAVFGADGTMALADYRQGQILLANGNKPPTKFTSAVNIGQLALSPDGRSIAGAVAVFGGARVWNVPDAKQVFFHPAAWSVAFSSDGRWLATGGTRDVRLVQTADWSEVHRITDCAGDLVAFQPGGGLLATLGPHGAVHLYDADSAQLIARLPHSGPGAISSLAFSSDGRRLFAVRRHTDVSVWDLAQLQSELEGLGLALPARIAPSTVSDSPDKSPPPTALSVDRGGLPSADRWYRCWRHLALFEAKEKLWPDAIANLERAIQTLPHKHGSEMAELLTLRGDYQLRNGNAGPARDSWESAIRLEVANLQATRRLTRLCLLGPPELRSPERAMQLAGLLAGPDDSAEDRGVRALAHLRAGQLETGLTQLAALALPAQWQPEAALVAALAWRTLGDPSRAAEALAEGIRLREVQAAAIDEDRRADLDRLEREARAVASVGSAAP